MHPVVAYPVVAVVHSKGVFVGPMSRYGASEKATTLSEGGVALVFSSRGTRAFQGGELVYPAPAEVAQLVSRARSARAVYMAQQGGA